jgi:uncharacterized protein
MRIGQSITRFSVGRPKTVGLLMVASTLVIGLLAGLPSLWPETFSSLHGVKVDTDPENMLPADEEARVFHRKMKKDLKLYDMLVLGVVNEKHPEGVFNVESLKKIHALTEFAKGLNWPHPELPGEIAGVIEVDLMAPSTVDNISQGATPGTVKFEWLMRDPPETEAEARAVREKARNIPMLYGTLISDEPGGRSKALCLYLPLTDKHLSHEIYTKINAELKKPIYQGDDQFHITGLPVAEDTFGAEMFKQMAISAPIAMLVIFLLMLVFFRKLILIVSPMIVAMVSVIVTMGFLISTGNTVHIMSSMIPIFIMPIAVLDAIHILSDFFDRYQETRDRKKTVVAVMDTLFMPMLCTSLTTAVGFGSLALTPIPPVQTFGVFIAFGVMVAWLWTVTFIPAYIMLIPQSWLKNFGLKKAAGAEEIEDHSLMGRALARTGRFTSSRTGAYLVMVAVGMVALLAAFGIKKIKINDNPVKWFEKEHPIRVADRVLNKHFGGTYMAYLALLPGESREQPGEYMIGFGKRFDALQTRLNKTLPAEKVIKVLDELRGEAVKLIKAEEAKGPWAGDVSRKDRPVWKPDGLLAKLEKIAEKQADDVEDDDEAEVWDELRILVGLEKLRDQVFKRPEVLRYIGRLQEGLKGPDSLIGKSSSLADIVRTVHRELRGGAAEHYSIPKTSSGVAQCLMQFQNSHRPRDLSHFVTDDYRRTSLWLQLKSGDNKNMEKLIAQVDDYFAANPPPAGIKHKWFGLTYINVVWQEKMVAGMAQAFLGSFLVVLLMMTLLFRSALWGLLSMVPLTVTIGAIYGAIGWVGKDYDMPVAVLSSLSLGLAVDYAIHFLARSRELRQKHGSWAAASGPVFGEPARAISRNVIVIGVGFLPLLFAPLVPYKTVGVFIAAILLVAGFASLLILPALIGLLEKYLFPQSRALNVTCLCGTCIVSAAALVALVAINLHQFLKVDITPLSWGSLVGVVVLASLCAVLSKREKCGVPAQTEEKGDN